jgi:hypothetical protein
MTQEPQQAKDQDDNPVTGFVGGIMDRRRERKEEEARLEAERQAKLDAARHEAFQFATASCPLPIIEERVDLPGDLDLFNDEFLVSIARDWGITTKKLILTTHRLIHAKGILTKDQEIVNLADVTNVNYHKSMLFHGSIEIETQGENSLTGLPRAQNAKETANHLLELVNWAKHRPQMVQQVAGANVSMGTVAVHDHEPDKYEQLKKLAELKSLGVLNDVEFEAEKAKLLAGD